MAIPTTPEDAQARASILAAETEKIEPDQLRGLALRVGREGMQACRRLKRAADGRP